MCEPVWAKVLEYVIIGAISSYVTTFRPLHTQLRKNNDEILSEILHTHTQNRQTITSIYKVK